MRGWLQTLGGLGALLLAGCQAPEMRTGIECPSPERVAAYRTFAWVGAPVGTRDATFITPGTLEKLEAAIVDALQYHDLRLESAERADLLVGYRVSTEEFPDPRTQPMAGWGGWGRNEPAVPTPNAVETETIDEHGSEATEPMASDDDPRTYFEAHLAIEMTERRSGEIVWLGWAAKEITQSDREDPGLLARSAAEAVIEGYPRENCL